uniref:Uncharacterized protein n=1 Tax=Timema genevievae TaxID=629358 RepID=A0A7R9JQ82_TIMGE|nr:unnamed protein product [Timema genevievae]
MNTRPWFDLRMSVSRSLRAFGEPNRPPDWFSQKSCAVQYATLLENVETPKRKKRGEKGEMQVETPGESIARKLTQERIEELKRLMHEERTTYLQLKEEMALIKSGQLDDKLGTIWQQIEEEKKQKEKEAEQNTQWLKERQEKKLELERVWKPPVPMSSPFRRKYHRTGPRRNSSQSEPSSEADSAMDSPLSEQLNVDVVEEAAGNTHGDLKTARVNTPIPVVPLNPAPTPTSPLLTSLLKTSQRGSSPSISSLLHSSPGVGPPPPTSVSSSLKNLVSSAISSAAEEHLKPQSTSPAAGAPTLSMLLELPPSLPGKPLPELPTVAKPPTAPQHSVVNPPSTPTTTTSTASAGEPRRQPDLHHSRVHHKIGEHVEVVELKKSTPTSHRDRAPSADVAVGQMPSDTNPAQTANKTLQASPSKITPQQVLEKTAPHVVGLDVHEVLADIMNNVNASVVEMNVSNKQDFSSEVVGDLSTPFSKSPSTRESFTSLHQDSNMDSVHTTGYNPSNISQIGNTHIEKLNEIEESLKNIEASVSNNTEEVLTIPNTKANEIESNLVSTVDQGMEGNFGRIEVVGIVQVEVPSVDSVAQVVEIMGEDSQQEMMMLEKDQRDLGTISEQEVLEMIVGTSLTMATNTQDNKGKEILPEKLEENKGLDELTQLKLWMKEDGAFNKIEEEKDSDGANAEMVEFKTVEENFEVKNFEKNNTNTANGERIVSKEGRSSTSKESDEIQLENLEDLLINNEDIELKDNLGNLKEGDAKRVKNKKSTKDDQVKSKPYKEDEEKHNEEKINNAKTENKTKNIVEEHKVQQSEGEEANLNVKEKAINTKDENKNISSNDLQKPRHSKNDENTKNVKAEDKTKHSRSEDRDRHGKDEQIVKSIKDEEKLKHSKNEVKSQNSKDGKNKHSKDGGNVKYTKEEERYKHGKDDERYKHGKEDERHKHGKDDERYKHGKEDERYKHGKEDERFKHGKDDERYKHGKEDERYRHGKDDERYKHGKEDERYKSGKEDERYKHGKEDDRYKHGKDDDRYKHGKDDERHKHGKDDERYKHGKEDERYKSGKENERYKHGKEDERYKHGKDDERYKHGKEDERHKYGKDDEKAKHSKDDEKSKYSKESEKSKSLKENEKSKQSKEIEKHKLSKEDEKPKHSKENEKHKLSNVNEKSKQSKEYEKHKLSKEDEKTKHSKENEKIKHLKEDIKIKHVKEDGKTKHSKEEEKYKQLKGEEKKKHLKDGENKSSKMEKLKESDGKKQIKEEESKKQTKQTKLREDIPHKQEHSNKKDEKEFIKKDRSHSETPQKEKDINLDETKKGVAHSKEATELKKYEKDVIRRKESAAKENVKRIHPAKDSKNLQANDKKEEGSSTKDIKVKENEKLKSPSLSPQSKRSKKALSSGSEDSSTDKEQSDGKVIKANERKKISKSLIAENLERSSLENISDFDLIKADSSSKKVLPDSKSEHSKDKHKPSPSHHKPHQKTHNLEDNPETKLESSDGDVKDILRREKDISKKEPKEKDIKKYPKEKVPKMPQDKKVTEEGSESDEPLHRLVVSKNEDENKSLSQIVVEVKQIGSETAEVKMLRPETPVMEEDKMSDVEPPSKSQTKKRVATSTPVDFVPNSPAASVRGIDQGVMSRVEHKNDFEIKVADGVE